MLYNLETRTTLRQFLFAHFGEADLRILAFDIGVNEACLQTGSANELALSLIQECERADCIPELIAAMQRARQSVSMPPILAQLIHKPAQKVSADDDIDVTQSISDPLPRTECPFTPGTVIDDPERFVGRADMLREMRRLVTDKVSIHLWGAARIGKTSLLKQFICTSFAAFNSRSVMPVYVSVQSLSTFTPNAFYVLLAQGIVDRYESDLSKDLRTEWLVNTKTFESFKRTLANMNHHRLLPVFCIDEFDTLLQYSEAFDNTFYKNLRSITQSKHAVFLLATRIPLVGKDKSDTSKFMNDGHKLKLDVFTEAEADILAALPRNPPAALTIADQRLARIWGGLHPYLLQMACYQLWAARLDGRNSGSAYERFKQQSQILVSDVESVPVPLPSDIKHKASMADIGYAILKKVGQLPSRISAAQDWLTGVIVLVVIMLVLFGIIGNRNFVAWLCNLLGLSCGVP